MIKAEEMKKLTKERQANIINNAMVVLEAIMRNSTRNSITISLRLLEFPEYLLPELESTLNDFGYSVSYRDSCIITISWD